MTDENASAFRFQWGDINLEVEGGNELVKEGFDLLKNEVLDRIDETQAAPKVPAEPREDPAQDPDAGDDQPPTPAEYIEEKKPSNNMERAIVLAHYAKHFRDQETLTGEQLERLINQAHIQMFSAPDALYNADRNRGWMERVGTGTFELTAAGENYVQTQLPSDNG